jgi:predicted RND superfamily exporter protein
MGRSTAWHRIADGLIDYRHWAMAFASLVALVAWPAAQRLRWDISLEGMFSEAAPLRQDFLQLKERFPGSQLLMAVYRDEAFWEADGSGLSRQAMWREAIEQVPGVRQVLDLSSVDQSLRQWAGPHNRLLASDSPLARRSLALLADLCHQQPGPWLAMVVLLDPQLGSGDTTGQTLASLKRVLAEPPEGLDSGWLIGETVMLADGFQLVADDGRRLGWMTGLLLIGLLCIGLRSWRWALISVVVVQWSLLVTRGCLGFLGLPMSMVSSMLTALVTVIAVAAMMHWMLAHQRQMSRGLPPERSLRLATAGVLQPVFWSALTNAIAFASLLLARVGPVQDYGLMMSLSSLIVLLGLICWVPGLSLLATGLGGSNLHIPGRRVWDDWLSRSAARAVAHRRLGLWLTAGLLLYALLGMSKLEVETDFLKNFDAREPIAQGYRLVEENFGGAGVWDILLPAPQPLTSGYLAQVAQLQGELQQLTVADGVRLSKVVSLVDLLAVGQTMPLVGTLPVPLQVQALEQVFPAVTELFVAPQSGPDNPPLVRIWLRSSEGLPAGDKQQLIEAVRERVDERMSDPAWLSQLGGAPNRLAAPVRGVVTGYYVLLSGLVSSLLADQWWCLGLAASGIAIALRLSLRSWPLAVLALIPNSLPALVVLASFGWLGIPANIGLVLIATVALGLSIDASLHYLIHLRQAAAEQNESLEGLLVKTQQQVGLAMLLSCLALSLGFSILLTSPFQPTVVFGAAISLTLVGGLIGNLWWLPLLVRYLPNPTRQ